MMESRNLRNKVTTINLFKKQLKMLDELRKELPMSRSAIVRVAIQNLYKMVCEKNAEKC